MEYEFILKFALPSPDDDPSNFLDSLYEAGCGDDAVIGVGKRGTIALDFSRHGASAEEAVLSAVQDVTKAIPGAVLTEVTPDLVTLAGVADVIGCSRQNIRKYAAGEIKALEATFPRPVVSGAVTLWSLYEVTNWFKRNTDLHPPRSVIEVSKIARRINVDIQLRRAQETESIAAE
jgi:predicted DNA-binding transcriptional regulator AlpA